MTSVRTFLRKGGLLLVAGLIAAAPGASFAGGSGGSGSNVTVNQSNTATVYIKGGGNSTVNINQNNDASVVITNSYSGKKKRKRKCRWN